MVARASAGSLPEASARTLAPPRPARRSRGSSHPEETHGISLAGRRTGKDQSHAAIRERLIELGWRRRRHGCHGSRRAARLLNESEDLLRLTRPTRSGHLCHRVILRLPSRKRDWWMIRSTAARDLLGMALTGRSTPPIKFRTSAATARHVAYWRAASSGSPMPGIIACACRSLAAGGITDDDAVGALAASCAPDPAR